MEIQSESPHDLGLLEQIEKDPDATQATLAFQLGVAVGTVNWHLKRLINKGYVKVRRAERRKLRYIITPEGISFRTHLALDFAYNSFKIYRETRAQVADCLGEVRRAGYHRVRLVGDGDIADICRLTCLEQAIAITNEPGAPVLEVSGIHVTVKIDGDHPRE